MLCEWELASQSFLTRVLRPAIGFTFYLAILLTAGCGRRPEVVEYEVVTAVASAEAVTEPRTPHLKADQRQTPDQAILAAIIERGNELWFFKAQGTRPQVERIKPEFLQILKSVRFEPSSSEPLRLELPEGWTKKAGSGLRYATLVSREGNPEVSVVVLPRIEGFLEANVSRWCSQIGLPALSREELDSVVTKLTVGGRPAYVVFLKAEPETEPGGEQTDSRNEAGDT